MKKLFKIYILFTLFIFIFMPFINTSAIDMNLSTDQDYNTYSYDDITDDDTIDEVNNAQENTNIPTVTTTSTDDEFLTIENILSIIIIVIGIILIFLGIAILIRCKS